MIQNFVLRDSLMGTRAARNSRCSFIASFPFVSGTGLCMRDMARVFLSLVPLYLFQCMLQCWYQSFHALCNRIRVAGHIDDLKQVPKAIRNYSTKHIIGGNNNNNLRLKCALPVWILGCQQQPVRALQMVSPF